MLAPIVLFVYNRPVHTLKTLQALAANTLAPHSKLYIFQDGLRSNASEKEIKEYNEVASVISSFNWPGQLEIIVSPVNKGLAASIIGGVTNTTAKHGKIIVLEDDLITSAGFLQYMNDALTTYEHEPRVMHVSGYLFPVHLKLSETFFHTTTNSWGWATWKNRWVFFNNNATELYNQLQATHKLNAFNLDGYGNSLQQLQDNMSGKINTWAVKWEASVFLQGGFCLYPGKSLLRNIGHDDTGVHCSAHNYELYTYQPIAESVSVKKKPLQYNNSYRNRMKYFVRLNGSVSLISRIRFDAKRARYKLKSIFK